MGGSEHSRKLDSHLSRKLITRRDFLGGASLLCASIPAVSYFAASPHDAWFARAQNATQANVRGNKATLENDAIAATWEISPAGLRFLRIVDRRTVLAIDGPTPAFSLTRSDGSSSVSSEMNLIGDACVENLEAVPEAARFSERLHGRALSARFEDAQHRVRAEWRAILRDGSYYIRQEVTLTALQSDLPITKITLIDLNVPGARVTGSAKGSPATSATWFVGFEHPLSESSVERGRVLCSLERHLPLELGRAATYSSVIGVSETGQLRRDFLRYVERERAHPYRTFLHYNSWYDLGYFTPYDQAGALDVINAFGAELHAKRGVTLDSFYSTTAGTITNPYGILIPASRAASRPSNRPLQNMRPRPASGSRPGEATTAHEKSASNMASSKATKKIPAASFFLGRAISSASTLCAWKWFAGTERINSSLMAQETRQRFTPAADSTATSTQ